MIEQEKFEKWCNKHLKFNDQWDDLKTCYSLYEELVSENKELQQKLTWLNCLETAGVDNWDGIDYAYDLMKSKT